MRRVLVVVIALLGIGLVGLAPSDAAPKPVPPLRTDLTLVPDGIVTVSALPPAGTSTLGDTRVQIPRGTPTDNAPSGSPNTSVNPPSGPGPTVGASFRGLGLLDNPRLLDPPDTQVAAGPNHVVEMINITGRVFTKSGALLHTFELEDFFLAEGNFLADPKIRYDTFSGRWFAIAATAGTVRGRWRLAVSTSSDPMGAWVVYSYRTEGAFPDYPSLGISNDKVVLTANVFSLCDKHNRFLCDFLGYQFVVFDKAALVSGAPVATNYFQPERDSQFFNIEAAHSLSSTNTLFMGQVENQLSKVVRVWSVVGVPGLGAGSSYTTVDRAIGALRNPPEAKQPLGASVETNDNRILDAVYRNGSLWLSANAQCKPLTASQACMRFIEISTTSSITVRQDFDFGTDASDYYYPAIQIDANNNLITVFNRSSPTEFISVYASGRRPTDPLNTLRTPTLIKAGQSHMEVVDRWGDYSGAGVDPADPTKVWVASEWAETPEIWGTWIAQVSL